MKFDFKNAHFLFYIYNEYSAKLQKAISGRGKNIMAPFEDKQKKYNLDYSTNTSTSKILHILNTLFENNQWFRSYIDGVNEFQSLIVRGKKLCLYVSEWIASVRNLWG